jgi:cytoskeletal protein CcmA (bactofilin family)
MKPTNKQEVTCPHCQAAQSEPVGAISTNCRACGRYFKIDPSRDRNRSARAPKASREVFCIKCGAPNLVAAEALSTQCIRCLHYLELGDKVIRGVQTGKLYAYDDVVFAEGCSFKGMEATGRRIEVRGKVFSKLRATAEIVALPGAELSGELHAPVVQVEQGAKVRVQTVECSRLRVNGEMEISGRLEVSEIELGSSAVFSGRLHNAEAKIKVERGAKIAVESMTCAELQVDGTVTLAGTLVTPRVLVGPHGQLTASRVRTNRLEVNSGGLLQGMVENYPAAAPEGEPTLAETS